MCDKTDKDFALSMHLDLSVVVSKLASLAECDDRSISKRNRAEIKKIAARMQDEVYGLGDCLQ